MNENILPGSIKIEIFIDGARDNIEQDEVTRNLDNELAELPFISALTRDRVAKHPQQNLKSKSGELVTLGNLVMQVLPSAAPNLIDFLKSWALRPGNNQLKIRAEGNAGSLEIEFNPDSLSVDKVKDLATDLQKLVKE